jgi:hypothetical protein
MFMSKQAMKDAGLDKAEFVEVMESMGDSDMMGSDPCDRSSPELVQFMIENGYPLKEVFPDGTTSEVTRIVKNVSMPPGGFALPKGYKVQSMGQMMSEAYGGSNPFQPGSDSDPDQYRMSPEQDADVQQQLDKLKGMFESFQGGGN